MHFHRNTLFRFPNRPKLLNLVAHLTSADGTVSQQKDDISSKNTDTTIRFPDFVSRQKFTLPSTYEKQDWYPKHMGLQLKVMEGKLRTIDLVIEVHDARVALTGRNPSFGAKLYSIRPHILVLNKMDLINMKRYKEPIEEYYRNVYNVNNICWTNCKDMKNKDQFGILVNKMLDLLRNEHRFNRMVKTEYQVMVVGIPNTGKSSLINALRNANLDFGKAVTEGARPGVTVRVQNRVRILDRPLTYLLDTPGVLNPWTNSIEAAMKLAVCNLVLQTTTRPNFVADYLLYFMNKFRDFSYVDFLKLEAPTDDIKHLLLAVSKFNKITSNVYNIPGVDMAWDTRIAASNFVDLFRNHAMDRFLDRDLLGFRDSVTDEEFKDSKRKRRKITR